MTTTYVIEVRDGTGTSMSGWWPVDYKSSVRVAAAAARAVSRDHKLTTRVRKET